MSDRRMGVGYFIFCPEESAANVGPHGQDQAEQPGMHLMAYASLRDFIFNRLEPAGRLVRVKEPVSTFLEMTEIQTRLMAEGGPAVLFENVVGQDGRPHGMSVLVNLFGTVERVAWGMEREPEQYSDRVGGSAHRCPSQRRDSSWFDCLVTPTRYCVIR